MTTRWEECRNEVRDLQFYVDVIVKAFSIMDPKVVKKTQSTLGKYVKRPPLTEKLLSKPPFRFLHDVTTSVIKNTGFAKGLFSAEQMNSDNVKDRDSKIAFLQKLIDLVQLVIERPLSVRPNKVIAGHEPERTNEFLQAIAEAVEKKVDNKEYVKRVLSGEKFGKNSEPPREKSGGKEKKKPDNQTQERQPSSKERQGSSKDRKHSSTERQGSSKRRGSLNEREDSGKGRQGSSINRDRGEKSRFTKDRSVDENDNEQLMANGDLDLPDETSKRPARPPSAKGARRRQRGPPPPEQEKVVQPAPRREKPQPSKTDKTEPDEVLPPQVAAARAMARPPSARHGNSQVLRKKDEAQAQESALAAQHRTNLIQEGGDSDDDAFLVEENQAPVVMPDMKGGGDGADDEEESEDHGGLVRKILRTKKDLEHTTKTSRVSGIGEGERRKQRALIQSEVDKLRTTIQSLTRSANPLGKTMDYVQEDLDSMQKELEDWRKENREHVLSLRRAQNESKAAIEPIHLQLKELDAQIADQIDAIAATKANIALNEDKVAKMISL